MKKKVEFSSIEAELKKQFNLLMTNPEAFNLEEEEIQHIKELSSFAKRAGWKIVKKDAQITLAKQNDDELALAVIEDLEEDGVKIVSKRSLELLLQHPENPEFQLEETMIEHIKALSSQDVAGLKHALAHDLDIDEVGAESKSIGQKILDTFKLIWSGLAPIFSSIVIKLAGFAGAMAEKAIEDNLNGELGKELGGGADKVIESIGLGLAGAIKPKAKEESKEREEGKEMSLNMSMKLPVKVKEKVKVPEKEKVVVEKAIPVELLSVSQDDVVHVSGAVEEHLDS